MNMVKNPWINANCADLECFDGVSLVEQFEVLLLQQQKFHFDDLFWAFQVHPQIFQNCKGNFRIYYTY